eukprot:SAG11_NODE_5372_length_1580_cov_2.704929_2_plen_123_part_00
MLPGGVPGKDVSVHADILRLTAVVFGRHDRPSLGPSLSRPVAFECQLQFSTRVLARGSRCVVVTKLPRADSATVRSCPTSTCSSAEKTVAPDKSESMPASDSPASARRVAVRLGPRLELLAR